MASSALFTWTVNSFAISTVMLLLGVGAAAVWRQPADRKRVHQWTFGVLLAVNALVAFPSVWAIPIPALVQSTAPIGPLSPRQRAATDTSNRLAYRHEATSALPAPNEGGFSLTEDPLETEPAPAPAAAQRARELPEFLPLLASVVVCGYSLGALFWLIRWGAAILHLRRL